MNPKQQHEEAMHYSFLAKQERSVGNEDKSLEYYKKSAELESQIADYFMDKPELEPTRSIIIRSAAFINLKAGNIERSEKFIFWGIVNSNDSLVKDQLYEALELCLAFRNINSNTVSSNVDYIYKMRQKSVFYVLEPKLEQYSTAVTLEMISDFSGNYIKSLKAYSGVSYRNHFLNDNKIHKNIEKEVNDFQEEVKPILTTAGFGSFKFSIATDFLQRVGESTEYTKLKSSILINYHEKVFSKELSDENIQNFKSQFNDDEVEQIFRPLFNIKSQKATYKIAYYDKETTSRLYIKQAKNIQKIKLLPPKELDSEDIGILEATIAHTRKSAKGLQSRSVISKQEFKSYNYDFRTNIIEPKNASPIILTHYININVNFDSEVGFTFSFDDLPIEGTAIIFSEGKSDFFDNFKSFVQDLRTKQEKTDLEHDYWKVIYKLIQNPEKV